MFQVNLLLGRIHMKNQALFSSKDKSKILKCRRFKTSHYLNRKIILSYELR